MQIKLCIKMDFLLMKVIGLKTNNKMFFLTLKFFLYLYFEIVQSYFENSFQLSDEDFFAPKMHFLRGCKIYVCI